MHYIEGGWPGANPKDDEFFRRAATELDLKNSTFVAFGSTRRPRGKIDQDQTLQNLISAGTTAVCIVGKCWDYHVTEALRVDLEEGVAMVRDSVEFLVANGLEVMYDAEHVFDGYKHNPEFSMQVLEAAAVAGASRLVLCDTNGGSLPSQVRDTVGSIVDYFGGDVGIGVHLHDDTGCGVANALAGVEGGAVQVQGTINGYGERTGNCNLVPIIGNLTLKMGIETIPAENMVHLTSVANQVAEIANFTPDPQQPYVGGIRVRTQGWPAHQRNRSPPRRLRTHRSGPGWEPGAFRACRKWLARPASKFGPKKSASSLTRPLPAKSSTS